MSVKATNYVLHNRFGNPTRKLIMLAIADHANDSGEAWPGIESLAFKAECSPRSVQTHLRELESSGDIQIQPPRPPARMANTYRIIFKNPATSEAFPQKAKTSPANSAPPQIPYESAYTPCTPTCPESAPESIKTIKNHQRERAHAPAQPPAEFSEDDFCDTLEFIGSLRPGWDTAFSAKERTAFSANAAALRSIKPEHRDAIRRFLSARLPQGHAYWQPKTRFQFLTDSSDVLAHALDWEGKQPKPATHRKTQPLQTAEEKAQAERDLAEWLAEQTAR